MTAIEPYSAMHGRGRVTAYVRAACKRRGVPAEPPPMVLLTGTHGCGGTMVLNQLWRDCSRTALGTRLDLATAGTAEDIVLAIMHGLHRKVPGIRALSFPRLKMAFKALNYVDDGSGRAGFDSYLKTPQSAAAVKDFATKWSDRVTPLLPESQQVPAAIAGELLGALLVGAGRRRDAGILEWFAEQGASGEGAWGAGAARAAGTAPLWRLRTWHTEGSTAEKRRAAKTLCAALLADLRADFNASGLLHGQRRTHCLLLIDNADSSTANLFLEIVDECRRDSRAAGLAPDPVLLVAVQHSPPPEWAGRSVPAVSEQIAWPANWTQYPASWWRPITLTDLRGDHLVDLARSAVLGRTRRDADFVQHLTGGHPASAAELLTLLPRLCDTPFSVRELLDCPLPADYQSSGTSRYEGARPAVWEHLLRRALPQYAGSGTGKPAASADAPTAAPADAPTAASAVDPLEVLAICAATPGLRRSACEAAMNYLGKADAYSPTLYDELKEALWLEEEPDGGQARLHPLLRLLLDRRLASTRDTWRDAHAGYVTHYRAAAEKPVGSQAENRMLQHYHQLALVDTPRGEGLSAVAGYLNGLYGTCPGSEWLRTLERITEAPNLIRTTGDPRAMVTPLAGAEKPGDQLTTISRLTVARWLYGDRYFDPSRRLARVVADEYEHLAQLGSVGGGADSIEEQLFAEAAAFRKIEREWGD